MAEKTFSAMVGEVLSVYPQIINSKSEVEVAKNEVLNAKNAITSELANAKSDITDTKNAITSELESAKTKSEQALNVAQKASNDASAYADSAKGYQELAKESQKNANDSVLAANAAKLKALEAQTKSEVYMSEMQSINASFKNVAKTANATLKNTALNVTDMLGDTTDFQLGRMEFKRRQVNAKIDEANEVIAKLEDSSAVSEIKRLLRENVWDHAILECGMMDVLLSKGIMMFLTIQTQDIKEQTALIAQEVELDRLNIQRLKESTRLASEYAQNLVRNLEAKVANI